VEDKSKEKVQVDQRPTCWKTKEFPEGGHTIGSMGDFNLQLGPFYLSFRKNLPLEISKFKSFVKQKGGLP